MAKKQTIPENPLADFGLADVVRGITSHDEAKVEEEVAEEKNEEKPAEKPAPKEKQEAEEKPAQKVSDDEDWNKFLTYAQNYYKDEGKDRGVTVWIDDEVKDVLDKIKSSGEVKVPVRHMVSAMCRIFIEEHKGEVLRVIAKGRKKNSLL